MPNPLTASTFTAKTKISLALGIGCLASVIYLFRAPPPWKGAAGSALKQHRDFHVEEFTQVGVWYGVVILAILLTLLLVTQRWWIPWSTRNTFSPANAVRPAGRWQWIGLICAVVLAGAMRVPLMDQGVRLDEHDNLRRNFHGFTAMDAKPKDDPWHPAGYREAMFENERANNPFLFSILSHASLDGWRAISGAPRDRFNVVAMRIPALLFGLLSIATVWGLGRRIGGPWVATTAALCCALHPLHIRYSVEARGYSVVLCLAPLFLSQCLEVVRYGHWRLAFGTSFSAAALLYAFPGGIYFIAAGAMALLLTLLWRDRSPENRATAVRLMVTGMLAVGILTTLMIPGVMQAMRKLDSNFEKNGLPAPWFAQTWSWMTVGIHNPLDHEYYGLRDGNLAWKDWWRLYLDRSPITLLVSLALIPALMVVGFRSMWRQGTRNQMILFISLGAPLLCLLHHSLVTHYSIFQWYMIYSLPPVVVIASVGLVQAVGGAPTSMAWKSGIAWACLIGSYVLATYPRVGIRESSYGPWMEDHGLPTAHSTFLRGPNTWVTYRDGRVLRLGKIPKNQ